MSEYQVIARRYRPKKFCDVFAQDAIVTTLKNAIKHQRLAHAYLFCGSRGTGKTTLARIFAEALNCPNLSADFEPCGECSSCREIAHGSSLDVLEIDGASHRGIDDIRQINETVGYASSSGGYKIIIIDEVHMLTKEAFNALLKTLEEPPERVKFFFATTEPHKVLPTILSRCQRFNLNRIPADKIIEKLKKITSDLQISSDYEALRMIALRADGGLRDAESLLDQIFSFHGSTITKEIVASILGIMPRDSLFELDKAGKEGRFTVAFDIAHQVFSQGKDLVHFVDTLTEHFRNILLVILSGPDAAFLSLSNEERQHYQLAATLYSQEQCMNIMEYLVEAQNQIRFAPSGRIALETILLHIMRTHKRIPIEVLVRRLAELEQTLGAASPGQPSIAAHPLPAANKQHPHASASALSIPSTPSSQPTQQLPPSPSLSQPSLISPPQMQTPLPTSTPPTPPPQMQSPLPAPPPHTPPPQMQSPLPAPTITPTQPLPAQAPKPPSPQLQPLPPTPPPQVKATVSSAQPQKNLEVDSSKFKEQHHYDTLMQFAAVELEGKLEKKQIKRK